MIAAVTGTPGAGKTFYAIRKIGEALAGGRMVATNVTMQDGWERRLARRALVRRVTGGVEAHTERLQDLSFYTDSLDELMRVELAGEGEARGIAVVDEAHEWLNARTWDTGSGAGRRDYESSDRARFIRFFAEHRHHGWDIFLLTQHLDSIDKQVRDRVEYHIVLRNLRRAKFMGLPVAPFNLFLAIWIWQGGPSGKRHVAKRELFLLDDRRKLYDTHGRARRLDGFSPDAIVLPRSAHPQAPATDAQRPKGAPAELIPLADSDR